MMLRLRWLLPALLLSGCATAPAALSRPAVPMTLAALPGGYTAQAVDSALIVQASEQARALLAGPDWLNDPRLSVVKVLSAETQVVAGTNVRLTMEVRTRDQRRWCRVVLFQGLHGERKLSSVSISPMATSQEWSTLGGPHDPPDGKLMTTGAQEASTLLKAEGWLGPSIAIKPTGGMLAYSWLGIAMRIDGTVVVGGKTRTIGVWVAHPIRVGGWMLGNVELGPPS